MMLTSVATGSVVWASLSRRDHAETVTALTSWRPGALEWLQGAGIVSEDQSLATMKCLRVHKMGSLASDNSAPGKSQKARRNQKK